MGKIKYVTHQTSKPYSSIAITIEEFKRIAAYLERDWAMDDTINQRALDFLVEIDCGELNTLFGDIEDDEIPPAGTETSPHTGIAFKIAKYENSKHWPHGGWNGDAMRWYPHKSIEGGNKTIAYGHKITPVEQDTGVMVIGDDTYTVENGLPDPVAMSLLNQDINIKITAAKGIIKKYETLPNYVKDAIINGFYRGDLSSSPKTLALMNSGKWRAASVEYLNNREYRNEKTMQGIKDRMDDNATAFAKYGEVLNG